MVFALCEGQAQTQKQHAEQVYLHIVADLGCPVSKCNSSCRQAGGELPKIEALFVDMAPEPQKGKPMPPGMINALLRVPKDAATCSVLPPPYASVLIPSSTT
mmetsp:Transcript_23260/g.36373  ORF Transcript_23260/g.36373 Transcript_23260/m.36373 type:complete len:102 (+) Transcript_23260:924-1229(+)